MYGQYNDVAILKKTDVVFVLSEILVTWFALMLLLIKPRVSCLRHCLIL